MSSAGSSRESSILFQDNEVFSDYGATSDSDFHRAPSIVDGLRNRFKRKRKHELFIPAVSEQYESLDYELPENDLQKQEEGSYRYSRLIWKRNSSRWIVCFLIGFFMAVIGILMELSTQISAVKFNYLREQLETCSQSGLPDCLILLLLIWIGINVASVLFATLLCIFLAPVAAGSGISQIKCFLNGVKIPGVLRLKTGVVKLVGLIASVFGGLAVGKEGPMIHTGAIVAGGISQGRMISFDCDFKLFEYFRSDREKRDFVSAGAAAGVAAAFNAPIGGVLFSMEEGSSFWTQPLTWRTFFCSMVCYFFLDVFISAVSGVGGSLSFSGLANFGEASNIQVNMYEIPIFIVMGVVGGLSGALFNYANARLALFRMSYITRWWHKCLESVFVAMTSAVAFMLLIVIVPACRSITLNVNITDPVQLFCHDNEYSEVVNLILQTPEDMVGHLFHNSTVTYHYSTLFLFMIIYWLLACWTYGLMIPSGLFVPQLLVGAAWGRIFGQILLAIFPKEPAFFNPGKYAIIGAAAQLGGVVRMTISLCVILMESVQSLRLGLPLMIVLVVAKLVGDRWNKGIYDLYIELAEVPLLPWEPPVVASTIPASRVLSAPVKVVRTREKVSRIFDILKSDTHNGYPVVSDFSLAQEMGSHDVDNVWLPPEDFGQFEGFITREQLIVLLSNRIFLSEDQPEADLPEISLKDFRDPFPRYKTQLNHISLNDIEMDSYMNLRPYMDPAPAFATIDSTLRKLFCLFRQLGVRHAVIVNKEHRVTGIVTRKDVARFRDERIAEERRYGIREVYVSK